MASQELRGVEEIIRYSPRRRASSWPAEGFSPTARAVSGFITVLTKVELVDDVEHPWNRAPHVATEMNFGLHSASSGRLARHVG